MSLDTLANVKSRLGITSSADNSLLDLLRDSADAFIAQHCGRSFEAGTFTEYFSGDAAVVKVNNYPINAVTSVKVDRLGGFGANTALNNDEFVVDYPRGLIHSRFGPFIGMVPSACCCPGTRAPQAVQVVYSTTANVPNDIKEAYALLVDHWYRHVKTIVASQYQNVTQQTFGDATAIFSKDQIAGLPLPADVSRILNLYRDPVV